MHVSQASVGTKSTAREERLSHSSYASNSPITPSSEPTLLFESPGRQIRYGHNSTPISIVPNVLPPPQYSHDLPVSIHSHDVDSPNSQSTDALGDRITIKVIVADYFQYIYPLVPLVHRPSFQRDFAANRDHADDDFLSLIYGICALTVASLPSKFQRYQNGRTSPSHVSRKAMVYTCYDESLRLKKHEYYDEITYIKFATHWMSYLAFFHVTEYNRARMVELEAKQLARCLNLHNVSEYGALDCIEIQLRKKGFWLIFYSFV